MRWWAIALVAVALPSLPAAAADLPLLVLRAAVSPPGPVWLGQRVTITLTAATPVRFADPPGFPELAPERGRALVLPEGTTVPGTERVGGQGYAALQHSYEIFPATAGALVLPPLRMSAWVAGPDGQPVVAEAGVTIPAITVRATAAGATDLTRIAVTPVLRVTSGVDRTPQGLRVGDAITRTVRIEAEDTAAMLLPPPLWGSPDGLDVYPDPPVLQDSTDRGLLRASRTDRAAYVPRQPGTLEIPGAGFDWLDPRTGTVRHVAIDPIRLEVLPAIGKTPVRGDARLVWAAAVLLVGVAAATATVWLRFGRGQDGEAKAFRALRTGCRSGREQDTYAALVRWIDLLAPSGDGGHSFRRAAALACTPGLAVQGAALEDRLYGVDAGRAWNAAALLAAVRLTRRRHRARAWRGARSPALPPLNPGATSATRPAPPVLRGWSKSR